MSIDIIISTISGNRQLTKLLPITNSIAIIEYNGTNIDGCKAIAAYLDQNDISKDVVTNIVLFGKTCKEIRQNKKTVESLFPYAEVTVPGKEWRGVDINCLDFNCALVLHMLQATSIVVNGTRINRSINSDLSRIVLHTRRAFHDIFFNSISFGETESHLKVIGKNTLADLEFTEDTNKNIPTKYCLEKKEYLGMYIDNISDKDIFFQTADEVENGCTICNQSTKYGHRKQCPLAQRHVAKCYREGIYVPQDDAIAHQWEVMAARQGYRSAKIQVADDFKDGVGCKQDLEKAISIYNEYAHFIGNEDCADNIIAIVEENDCYDSLIALPHIVRKANSGDNDMIYKLADAFKEGNYGLPKDIEQQKFWIEKGAESGETRFVRAMAEMYEEHESWDLAIKWYEKLEELELFDDYTDKINEIQGRLLQFDSLTPEEIAENGYAFLNGHGVTENFHLAYLCFEEAAKHENASGERGLAICYEQGYGVEINEQTSFDWNEKAAEHGNLRAMEELYKKYTNSDDFDDYDKADVILEKFKTLLPQQLETSYVSALRIAGDCYYNGLMNYEVDDNLAFEYYQKAANLGDVYSMNKVGDCYYDGRGTSKDYQSAFKWFLRAAELGDIEAEYNTGYCYYTGEGVTRDFASAFEFFRKSADRNYADSKYYLGLCYINGRGTTRNEDKGYSLVEEAANDDCGIAMEKLCQDYFSGKHYKKNYEKSRYWGEKALENDFTSVRFEVAYSSKETGYKDRAREIYTELANEGNIAAMNNLGCMETDNLLSADWFTKAADRGNAVAQCNIGRYYKNGRGVEQNYDTARAYFEKAANTGNADAMYELALLYRYGYGVETNYEEMVLWYERSANKGNKNAMIALAHCYKNSDLISLDYSKAMEYFLKAVELDKIDSDKSDSNEKEAIYNIGLLYENGNGVDKNISKAIFWYRKAANKNYSPAQEALKRLDTNWVDETGHATSGKENKNINDDLPF